MCHVETTQCTVVTPVPLVSLVNAWSGCKGLKTATNYEAEANYFTATALFPQLSLLFLYQDS